MAEFTLLLQNFVIFKSTFVSFIILCTLLASWAYQNGILKENCDKHFSSLTKYHFPTPSPLLTFTEWTVKFLESFAQAVFCSVGPDLGCCEWFLWVSLWQDIGLDNCQWPPLWSGQRERKRGTKQGRDLDIPHFLRDGIHGYAGSCKRGPAELDCMESLTLSRPSGYRLTGAYRILSCSDKLYLKPCFVEV